MDSTVNLDRIPVGIGKIANDSGDFIYANKTLLEHLGFDTIVGVNVDELVHLFKPEITIEMHRGWRMKRLQNPDVGMTDIKFQVGSRTLKLNSTAEGDISSVDITAETVLQIKTMAKGLVASTALRKAKTTQQKQAKTIKELELWAHLLRHDLANPVVQIARQVRELPEFFDIKNADLKLLGLDEDDEEIAKETWEILEIQAPAMEQTMNSLIEMSKGGQLNFEYFDLSTSLRKFVSGLAISSQVEIGDLGEVKGDENILLKSVFKNLLENAIRYNPNPDSRVWVSREDDVIYVKDNGNGIAIVNGVFDEKEYERLCMPEQRGGEGSGSGLGLHLAIRMLDAHGWEMEVDSSTKGTIFYWGLA